MSAARIALLAAGLLIAAGALFLVVSGLRGADAGPAAAPETAPAAADHGKGDDKAPPRWQSFLRPDERATPPRPVVHVAQGVPNPFDRLPNGIGGMVKSRPVSPGFRLEGVSAGARPVALISGHAVREGETIDGFRVVRIGRTAVTLAGPAGSRIDLALEDPRSVGEARQVSAPRDAPRDRLARGGGQ